MAADFNGPIPADGKIEVLQTIRDNQDAIATAFDGDPTAANKPTNAFRVDQSDGQAYKWNGSAWVSIGFISLTRDPVGDITDGAPAALDTLNELAAALADDANFASTVTTSLDGKMAKSSNLSDLTNTATARNNLDVYSKSEVDNLIDGVETNSSPIYISRLGSGNQSGSDVNNRMPASLVNDQIEKYNTVHFSFAAEDYTSGGINNYVPFERSMIENSNILARIEGDTDFGILNMSNSSFFMYKLDNTNYDNVTFQAIVLERGSKFSTIRDEDTFVTPQNTTRINVSADNSIKLRMNSIFEFTGGNSAITTPLVQISHGSRFYSSVDLNITSTSSIGFFLKDCSSLYLEGGAFDKPTDGGDVETNSSCYASGGYTDQTPTASTGGIVTS